MKNAEKQSERGSRLKAAFPDRRLQAAVARLGLAAFSFLPLAFLFSGCAFASYRRVPLKPAAGIPASWQPAGAEEVHFRMWLLFADEKLAKVALDRAQKNGSHLGLSIGSVEEKVDSEALDNLTTAVIAGVIKGLK
jgi:hypothetical protein